MTLARPATLVTLSMTAFLVSSCGLPATAGLRGPDAHEHPSFTNTRSAEPLDPRFFARREVEARAPKAFSLMPEAQAGLRAIEADSTVARSKVLEAIRANPDLLGRVRMFPTLTWEQQLRVLRAVFDLECRTLEITPPELVISTTEIKGPAYFDFDPARPGTGRVILNPEAIARDANPWTGLLLLIHETRHSAQFQLAFGEATVGASAFDPEQPRRLRQEHYRAAFVAQKAFSNDLNFSDFCSLNHEYDAFRFGNFIVGALTDWKADTLDMGCFSSQFDAHGVPRIDLVKLGNLVGYGNLLDAFNELEREQYRLLKGSN
jgi:hypothetical protein